MWVTFSIAVACVCDFVSDVVSDNNTEIDADNVMIFTAGDGSNDSCSCSSIIVMFNLDFYMVEYFQVLVWIDTSKQHST